MNGVLDTNDIQSVLNMEVDSEEEETVGRAINQQRAIVGGGHDDDDRMVDVEYDDKRPHAGTGGSSIMRSRPGQQPSNGLASLTSGTNGGRSAAQIIQNTQLLQQ